jgi:hypothetical protein
LARDALVTGGLAEDGALAAVDGHGAQLAGMVDTQDLGHALG